jgi:hypothetical protein
MHTHIDHLVVAAHTLEQGVSWCEATFGITPGPGGDHALYGTHNRLFKIATPANPQAYLEIIAVNPQAKRAADAPAKRWFDLDDEALQAALAQQPRLVHWVVGTDDLQGARAAWAALGLDCGPAVAASRHSRKGVLHWQITVREDGRRQCNGALPALIQWGRHKDADPLRLHPRNSLPRSRVSLQSIAVTHPAADQLQAAYAAIGLGGIALQAGPADLAATLQTPKGPLTLHSAGV